MGEASFRVMHKTNKQYNHIYINKQVIVKIEINPNIHYNTAELETFKAVLATSLESLTILYFIRGLE